MRQTDQVHAIFFTEMEKIWKVLGSATEWVGRGSIGWAGAVSAVPLPKSDFQHIKKVF